MMKITLTNHLLLTEIPLQFRRELMSRLTIPNPAYLDAEKMGRWTGNLSRELCFYRAENGGLSIPRGFIHQLIGLAKRENIPYVIEDRRRIFPEMEIHFAGSLKPFQEESEP